MDLYNILAVPRDADAKTIKSAFRRMARLHHPDLNPDDEKAQERFVELAAAFEILNDPDRRALYDEFGFESLQEDFDPVRARWERQRDDDNGVRFDTRPQDESWAARFRREFSIHNSSFRDTFESAFRDFSPFDTPKEEEEPYASPFAQPGEDIRKNLEIDLLTAIRGGSVAHQARDGATLMIRIPAGVENGETLFVAGEGEPSKDGGEPGGLWLTVQIAMSELFERDGLDLVIKVPVTITEALLGARVSIPTPHGDCVMTLPEGMHSGSKLRLREMGVHREGQKGDLYAVLEIKSPEHIDDAIRQAAEVIAKGYRGDVRARFEQFSRGEKSSD